MCIKSPIYTYFVQYDMKLEGRYSRGSLGTSEKKRGYELSLMKICGLSISLCTMIKKHCILSSNVFFFLKHTNI